MSSKLQQIEQELRVIEELDLKQLRDLDMDSFTREQLVRLKQRIDDSSRDIKRQLEVVAGETERDEDQMLEWFDRAEATLRKFGKDSQRVQLALAKKRRLEERPQSPDAERITRMYGRFRKEIKRRCGLEVYAEIVKAVREQEIDDAPQSQ